MTHLVADDAMLAVLSQAKELAEIRDAQGNLVGFFASACIDHAREYAWVAARIDLAELQRRKENNLPGRRTREVFEHLKSLTQDEKMRAYLQTKIDRLRTEEASETLEQPPDADPHLEVDGQG
jgi:hypothetical protein